MAADTLEGKREAIVTEYILRILGLDVSVFTALHSHCMPATSGHLGMGCYYSVHNHAV